MGYFLPKPWLSRPLAEGPGSETPALFVSAVRYLYLLLLSFVLYYRPGSECLSHPLPLSCFNFHLHCFSLFLTTLCYGDSTSYSIALQPSSGLPDTLLPERVAAIIGCWPFPFTHLFLASTAGFLKLLPILLSLALSQVQLVAAPGPPPAVDTVEGTTRPPTNRHRW